MSLRIKIYFGFVVICILWGSSWAAVKFGLEAIPLLLSLGIRFSIAAIVLGGIVISQRLGVPTGKKFWKLALIISLTSFTVPFMLIYWAQVQIDSGLASILFATFPFWVAIFSHYLLPDEKITIPRIGGTILGFIGIVIIFNNGMVNVCTRTLLGMIAIIIGAIIQAFGLIALRRFGRNIHQANLTLWPMLMSIVPFFAASIVIEDYSSVHLNINTIGSIVYLSICCTVITFLIYFWLVKYVEAVILSLSAFITPVIAVIIAVIAMREKFTGAIYTGSALVLIGVAVAVISDIILLHRRKTIKT